LREAEENRRWKSGLASGPQDLDSRVWRCNILNMNAVTGCVRPGSSAGLIGGLQHRLARQFQVQVADWLDTCRDLADWEDRYLVETISPERLAEHLVTVDKLERVGQWLASSVSEVGSEPDPVEEQIRLALQDLRDSRAMWHADVPLERQAEILRDCFHES